MDGITATIKSYKEIKVNNKNHNKIKDMMKSFDKVKVFHHKRIHYYKC